MFGISLKMSSGPVTLQIQIYALIPFTFADVALEKNSNDASIKN